MQQYLFKYIFFFVIVVISICVSDAHTQEIFKNNMVNFQANDIDFNFKENFLVATGNVVIKSENRTLKADILYYNTRDNIIYAEGNIVYQDSDGNIFTPQSIEIDHELKFSKLNNLKGTLKDQSFVETKNLEKTNDTSYNMETICYTSCNMLDTIIPTWQIKSSQGVYNTQSNKLTLYNSWIEIFNVPILWSPYLSFTNMPEKREIGFLTPSFSYSQSLGYGIELPFYIPLGDSQSIMINNYIYEKETYFSYLPNIKYNGYIYDGSFALNASYFPKSFAGMANNKLKYDDNWHLFFNLNKEFSTIYRSKIQLQHASDIKYLNLYEINPINTAENNLTDYYVNEFFINFNNHVSFNLFSYQNIYNQYFGGYKNENDYNRDIEFSYSYLQDYTSWGAFNVNFDVNTFIADDNIGNANIIANDDVTRINLLLEHDYLLITNHGYYSTSIQYNNTIYANHNPVTHFHDKYFSYYNLSLKYEYPIILNQFVISPMYMLSSNNTINKNENEIIFDDSNIYTDSNNIFDNSIYENHDWAEDTHNISYGLKVNGYINNNKSTILVGERISYLQNSVLFNNLLDRKYFISMYIQPFSNFNIKYDATFLNNFQQDEINLAMYLTSSIISLSSSYVSKQNVSSNGKTQELVLGSNININQNFIFTISTTYDPGNKSLQLKQINSTITWFNQCLYWQLYRNTSYYENNSSNSYGIRLVIKGVGSQDFKIL